MNTLYYGDNLNILRDYIKDESVDLIYLDPPFNSNRNYNVLFKNEAGSKSESQITAFEDTWHWNLQAEQTYNELITSPPSGDELDSLRPRSGNMTLAVGFNPRSALQCFRRVATIDEWQTHILRSSITSSSAPSIAKIG